LRRRDTGGFGHSVTGLLEPLIEPTYGIFKKLPARAVVGAAKGVIIAVSAKAKAAMFAVLFIFGTPCKK
jgi:hypothetical protein